MHLSYRSLCGGGAEHEQGMEIDMRKNILGLAAFALLLAVPVASAAAAELIDVTAPSGADYFDKPSGLGKKLGTLEPGRKFAIGNCSEGWCEITGGYVRVGDLDLSNLPDGDPRKSGDAGNGNGGNGNGGNGGGDGGGADQAVAANGTTIYKQPNGDESDGNIAGYVDAGGPVTVVQCNDGFCQISAPTAGYVWHEDIGK